MMDTKVRIIIIDENRNSVELEMDRHLYRMLGIKGTNIKTHKRRIDLNKSVTEFLNRK